MISTSPPHPESESDNTVDFRRVFLTHVHQLIKLGYDRLTPAGRCGEQEETITGFLVKAIEGVLDYPSDDWMGFFSVHEDPRVHDRLRKGKRRRRVDIRVDSSLSRPRTRFSFEAKRLCEGHPVTGDRGYLGPEGLGCFLRGDYARDDCDAGMLGYVQSESPEVWAGRIATALSTDPQRYEVCPGGEFAPFEVVPELNHGYHSCHNRPTVGYPISIFHTLLQFN